MSHSDRAVQVGGAWLAMASFLMIGALGLHGPLPPELHERMAMVAGAAGRWAFVHWVAAAALSLFAVSGLIVLTSESRLTAARGTLSAWAVVCVGSLWTMSTAVAETTVVAEAAVAGSEETFAAWWAFAEGKANGFAILALAVAAIARSEARSPAGATPPWSAWIAVVAGIGSFSGWALGMWLGVDAGNLLWVVASIVMCFWTLWLGAALLRAPVPAARLTPPGPQTAAAASTSFSSRR